MVFLQVAPEQSGQGAGHVLQRGVVDVHRALGEVDDQEVAYRGAGDALPVDHGCRCQLSRQHHRLQPCRGVEAEGAEAREGRVEEVLAVVAVGLVLAYSVLQLDAVADGGDGRCWPLEATIHVTRLSALLQSLDPAWPVAVYWSLSAAKPSGSVTLRMCASS
ncbi:hypothetical protein [Streptomyces sp. NPDC048266]|uniref:hypothetical protein n=1 Tax=Streptomyces sp. NPDC048266 TaxID=3155787 RepID=UPI003400B856